MPHNRSQTVRIGKDEEQGSLFGEAQVLGIEWQWTLCDQGEGLVLEQLGKLLHVSAFALRVVDDLNKKPE